MKFIIPISSGALRMPKFRKRRSRRKQTLELNTLSVPSLSDGSESRLTRRRLYLGVFAYFVLICGVTAFCAVCLFIMSDQAFGQEVPAAAPASGSAATRIEVDEEAGVIRFFVDGQQAAQLDAGGLHVREDLNYGGVLLDYGQSGFDNQTGWANHEPLKAEGRDGP